MLPILRASLPGFHPTLLLRQPRPSLPNRTFLPPDQQNSRCCVCPDSSRRFLPPSPSKVPARGLSRGPPLGQLRSKATRLQTICAASAGAGVPFAFLSWYLNALNEYPVSTKSVTSAFLTLFGDVICQRLIDQVPELDLKRTFVFTFLGLVLVGPTLHFWYLYLSKLVSLQGASGALVRLLLDQFIFSPIFIGVFLCSLVTLEGRLSQLAPKLQQEWFSSVIANWKLWIPFQFLNFWFIPQQFQVLGANFVALMWNVILSFKAHKEIKQEAVTE